MRRFLWSVGISFLIITILITLFIVDQAIYPFKASNPNFSDVERHYAALKIPQEWPVIGSSQNSGTRGRTCPISSESACFHKSKTFKTTGYSEEQVKAVIYQNCTDGTPRYDEIEYKRSAIVNFRCAIANSVNLKGTYDGGKNEFYLSISTN